MNPHPPFSRTPEATAPRTAPELDHIQERYVSGERHRSEAVTVDTSALLWVCRLVNVAVLPCGHSPAHFIAASSVGSYCERCVHEMSLRGASEKP